MEPIIILTIVMQIPNTETIRKGITLYEVIPLSASELRLNKLNFERPTRRGFTSNFTYEVLNPTSLKNPLKKVRAH